MKEIILAFIGSYCPAVLFNIERRNLIWAGLCGALGWFVYSNLLGVTGSIVFAVLSASISISLFSEILARILKTPSTVFYIPSIFPLVPGIPAYSTIVNIVEGKLTEAMYMAVDTLATAGAIAFGIMLVSTFFQYVNRKLPIAAKKDNI